MTWQAWVIQHQVEIFQGIPQQERSAPGALFNPLGTSEGCKQMGKVLTIFLICLHGKIRLVRKSGFVLRRASVNLPLHMREPFAMA